MKTQLTIKLTAIAAAMAFNAATISAAEVDNDIIMGWQSSLEAEFVKLDASGNGLLLPAEASKNKAFNKKTFATADADGDGTIDQAEYIQYKTSMGAKDVPAATTMSNEPSGASNMTSDHTSSAKAVVDEPAPTIQTAEVSPDNAASKKRSVGAVIDDSVITTKAKAAIFNTPDLKTLDISVQTRQGEVVLTGTVANEAAKMKAEEVVRNVGGVTSVTNSLEVKS